MVNQGRDRDVNEAASRFAETLAESYRLVYGQASESAERQQQRAREFSELVSSSLQEQTEAGRANARQLSEQAARQREAYAEFLNDAFSSYRAGTEQAAQSAQAGVRIGRWTTPAMGPTAYSPYVLEGSFSEVGARVRFKDMMASSRDLQGRGGHGG